MSWFVELNLSRICSAMHPVIPLCSGAAIEIPLNLFVLCVTHPIAVPGVTLAVRVAVEKCSSSRRASFP